MSPEACHLVIASSLPTKRETCHQGREGEMIRVPVGMVLNPETQDALRDTSNIASTSATLGRACASGVAAYACDARVSTGGVCCQSIARVFAGRSTSNANPRE